LNKTEPLRKTFILRQLTQLLHLDEQQISNMIAAAAPRRSHNLINQPESSNQTNEIEPGNSSAEPSSWQTRSAKENENLYDDRFALSNSRHRIKSIALTQLQAIGCILQDNSLFHYTASNGQSVDEALLPEEMELADHRRLYQKIYDRLSEGESVTLNNLLAELA